MKYSKLELKFAIAMWKKRSKVGSRMMTSATDQLGPLLWKIVSRLEIPEPVSESWVVHATRARK